MKVKKEFIQISSLIVEFSKSEKTLAKELSQRSTLEEIDEGKMYQTILKNWFYDPTISVNKNIGMSLRHLYLVKEQKEEPIQSKSWKLYVADDEGEEKQIVSKKSVFDFIKPNSVLLMRKNQVDLDFKRKPIKVSDLFTHEKKKKAQVDDDFDPASVKMKRVSQNSKQIKKLPKVDSKKKLFKITKKAEKSKKVAEKTAKKKNEEKVYSKCQKYSINTLNDNYMVDIEAVNILNSAKNEVYKTMDDFECDLISQLNQNTKIKYKAATTSKYVVVKCQHCKLFSFWYRNKDGIDIEALMKSGEKNFNLIMFRSINQNHILANHPQIEF